MAERNNAGRLYDCLGIKGGIEKCTMTEIELAQRDRDMWINGYINGAIDAEGDVAKARLEELTGWVADREYKEYLLEQADQALR